MNTYTEALDLFEDNFTTINTHGHYNEEEENQAMEIVIKALSVLAEIEQKTDLFIQH